MRIFFGKPTAFLKYCIARRDVALTKPTWDCVMTLNLPCRFVSLIVCVFMKICCVAFDLNHKHKRWAYPIGGFPSMFLLHCEFESWIIISLLLPSLPALLLLFTVTNKAEMHKIKNKLKKPTYSVKKQQTVPRTGIKKAQKCVHA